MVGRRPAFPRAVRHQHGGNKSEYPEEDRLREDEPDKIAMVVAERFHGGELREVIRQGLIDEPAEVHA